MSEKSKTSTNINDGGEGGYFSGIIITILVIALCWTALAVRFRVSDSTYTGYIYSQSSLLGYTKYSLRYSQNAAEDDQPTFKVATGGEEDRKLREFVGADKKVVVHVPPKGFHLSYNLFAPGSTAKLVDVIE